MNKRKTAPVWGLFYRETAPIFKNSLLCYVIAIALGIIFYLIKLSMEIGNLADMPDDKLQMLKLLLPIYAIYLPSVLFMINDSISSFQFEMGKNWRCYIASTPVSEWKYVGIKFIIMFSVLFIGMILSLINAAIMCSVYDIKYDKTIVANLLLCATIISLISTMIYILIFLFRNAIIGISIGFILLYGTMLFFFLKNISFFLEIAENETEATNMIMGKINDFSTVFMPFAIPCIIVLLTLGWVICSLLAKRREK